VTGGIEVERTKNGIPEVGGRNWRGVLTIVDIRGLEAVWMASMPHTSAVSIADAESLSLRQNFM
jgi:hypothetical protein